MDFKSKAREQVTLSPLMEGRDKVVTSELARKYRDGVNIVGIDWIKTEDGGYPCVIFDTKGLENVYYTGGMVLGKIVHAWLDEYNWDVSTCNHDLREQGGVMVRFIETKTRNGQNNLTTIEVL